MATCYVSGGRLYNSAGVEIKLRGVIDTWSLPGMIGGKSSGYYPGVGPLTKGCAQIDALFESTQLAAAHFGYAVGSKLLSLSPSINYLRIGAFSCEGIQAMYTTWRYDLAYGTTYFDDVLLGMCQGLESAGIYFTIVCGGFDDYNAYPADAQIRSLAQTMTDELDYITTNNTGKTTDNIFYATSNSWTNYALYIAHICDIVGNFSHLISVEIASCADNSIYKNLWWVNQGSSWAVSGDRETAYKTWVSGMATKVKALRKVSCLLSCTSDLFSKSPTWVGVDWGGSNDWTDLETCAGNLNYGLDIASWRMYNFPPQYCESYSGTATSYSCEQVGGATPQVWCGWGTMGTNMETYFRGTKNQASLVSEWGKYCNSSPEWVQTQADSLELGKMNHACAYAPGGPPEVDMLDYNLPAGWNNLPGTGGSGGDSGGTGTTTITDVSIGVNTAGNQPCCTFGLNLGKLFYDQGYYYYFYTDGTNICYQSSADLVTWGSKTSTGTAQATGNYFGVRCDPVNHKVHYMNSSNSTTITYRRGTINTNGTITWDFAAVTTNSGLTNGVLWSMALTADGYVVYGYVSSTSAYVDSGKYTTAWARRNDYSQSYPYSVTATCSKVIPLSDGWFWSYATSSTSVIYGKRFTEATHTLTSQETCTLKAQVAGAYKYTLTADGDNNVHLTHIGNSGSDTRNYYRKRTAAGTWDTAETDVAMAAIDNEAIPYITRRASTGDYIVWWLDQVGEKIYYRGLSSTGTWDTSTTMAKDETTATLYAPDCVSYASSDIFNGKIAIGYNVNNTPGPYALKVLYMTFGSTGGSGGGTTTTTTTTITKDVLEVATDGTTSNGGVGTTMQTKCGVAQNRGWVFYSNGTNLGHRSAPIDAVDYTGQVGSIEVVTRTPQAVTNQDDYYTVYATGVVKNAAGTQVYPSAGSTVAAQAAIEWAIKNLPANITGHVYYVRLAEGNFPISKELNIYRNVQGAGNTKTKLYAASGSLGTKTMVSMQHTSGGSNVLSGVSFKDVELDGKGGTYPTGMYGGLQLRYANYAVLTNLNIHDFPAYHGVQFQTASYNDLDYVQVANVGNTRDGHYGNGICTGEMYLSSNAANHPSHHNTLDYCTTYNCSMVGVNWEPGHDNTCTNCTFSQGSSKYWLSGSTKVAARAITIFGVKSAAAISAGNESANNSFSYCVFKSPGIVGAIRGNTSTFDHCTFDSTDINENEGNKETLEFSGGSADSATYASHASHSSLTNSVVTIRSPSGSDAVGLKLYGGHAYTVTNNTFYEVGTPNTRGIGIAVQASATYTSITGNVVNRARVVTSPTISGNTAGSASYTGQSQSGGSPWTTFTSHATSETGDFKMVFDGNTVYYLRNESDSTGYIMYRKGTLNSDGTVSWAAAESNANAGGSWSFIFDACIDSNGALVYVYKRDDYIYVNKMDTPGNTWSSASTYPKPVGSLTNSTIKCNIQPFSDGGACYILVHMAKSSPNYIYGYVLSSNTVGSPETASLGDNAVCRQVCLCSDNSDNMYLGYNKYTGSAYRMMYRRRNSSGTWDAAETDIVGGNVEHYTTPFMTIDSSGYLIYAWIKDDAVKYVPLHYASGGSLVVGSVVTLADSDTIPHGSGDSSTGSTQYANLMPNSIGGRSLMIYESDGASPYTVKFVRFTFTTTTDTGGGGTGSSTGAGTYFSKGCYIAVNLKVMV
jgi:hypothetical protein